LQLPFQFRTTQFLLTTQTISQIYKLNSENDVHYTTLHLFNGLFSSTTWVSRHQKGRTILDYNEARDDSVVDWQWHQPDHMQIILHLAPER